MDLVSFLEDSYVYMWPANKSDGSEYYKYALLYIDYVLIVIKNSEIVLREGIEKHFELKEESIGTPDLYLGGHVRKI